MPMMDGIVSGLDTTGLIDSILEASAAPLRTLQADLRDWEAAREAVAGIGKQLDGITEALAELNSLEGFSSFTATASSDDQFNVTAGSGSVPGTYSIQVDALARSHTQISDQTYADKDLAGQFGPGTIDFTIDGNTTQVTIDATNDSLQGLADAITNGVAGVTAYIVDTGFPGAPYGLVIQGEDTGVANTVTIDATNLPNAPTFSTTVAASDASIDVNGMTITSSSNTVTSLPGLTIDLTAKGTAPVNVTVAEDHDAIKEKIGAFVDAYNDLIDYYDKKTVYNPQEKLNGPLVGDSSVRRIMGQLGDLVSTAFSNSGDFELFAQAGIETQQTGKLKIDDEALAEALRENFDSVAALFTDAAGPAAAMTTKIEDVFVQEDTGIIASRTESIEGSIEDLERQIEMKEEFLENYSDRLRTQFTAMEMAMAEVQNASSFLFAMLPQQGLI